MVMYRSPIAYIYTITMTRNGVKFRQVLSEKPTERHTRLKEIMEIRDNKAMEMFGNLDRIVYDEKHPYGTYLSCSLRAVVLPFSRNFRPDQLEEAQAWVAEQYEKVGINPQVSPGRDGWSKPSPWKLAVPHHHRGADGVVLPVGVYYLRELRKEDGYSQNRKAQYRAEVGSKETKTNRSKNFSVLKLGDAEARRMAIEWRKEALQELLVEIYGAGAVQPPALTRKKRGRVPSPARPKHKDHNGNELPVGVRYVKARHSKQGPVKARYNVDYRKDDGTLSGRSFAINEHDADSALAAAIEWRRKHHYSKQG